MAQDLVSSWSGEAQDVVVDHTEIRAKMKYYKGVENEQNRLFK